MRLVEMSNTNSGRAVFAGIRPTVPTQHCIRTETLLVATVVTLLVTVLVLLCIYTRLLGIVDRESGSDVEEQDGPQSDVAKQPLLPRHVQDTTVSQSVHSQDSSVVSLVRVSGGTISSGDVPSVGSTETSPATSARGTGNIRDILPADHAEWARHVEEDVRLCGTQFPHLDEPVYVSRIVDEPVEDSAEDDEATPGRVPILTINIREMHALILHVEACRRYAHFSHPLPVLEWHPDISVSSIKARSLNVNVGSVQGGDPWE